MIKPGQAVRFFIFLIGLLYRRMSEINCYHPNGGTIWRTAVGIYVFGIFFGLGTLGNDGFAIRLNFFWLLIGGKNKAAQKKDKWY